MSKLDPRVYEVAIVLAREQEQRTLTAQQARRVLDNFDAVAKQAAKWRLSTQRAGRLLLIDPVLVREIERFLDSADPT